MLAFGIASPSASLRRGSSILVAFVQPARHRAHAAGRRRQDRGQVGIVEHECVDLPPSSITVFFTVDAVAENLRRRSSR